MKYSIIIPAFNAEKTVARCLDSIVLQSTDDVEIVIINDGSSDSTDEICKEYTRKYPFIFYQYKKNEGVAAARNDGIDFARGRYLIFVDSDDYLEAEFLRRADEILDEYKYDLILFSYFREKQGEKQLVSSHEKRCKERINTFKIISELISNKRINAPWAKIYDAEIVKKNHVNFTPGVSIAEDRAFNIKYALYCTSIATTDFPGYTVTLDNENSLSRSHNPKLKWHFAKADEDIRRTIESCNLCGEECKYIQEALDFGIYRSVYSDTKRMIKDQVTRKERYAFIVKKCKDINSKKLLYPHTRFAYLIVIPIKLKLTIIIDCVARYLAR